MNKNKITFEFDDEKDCKELLKCLDRYTELTWNNNTQKAMIKVFKKEQSVIVSKSVYEPPEPLRL